MERVKRMPRVCAIRATTSCRVISAQMATLATRTALIVWRAPRAMDMEFVTRKVGASAMWGMWPPIAACVTATIMSTHFVRSAKHRKRVTATERVLQAAHVYVARILRRPIAQAALRISMVLHAAHSAWRVPPAVATDRARAAALACAM